MLVFYDMLLAFQDLPKNGSTSMFSWIYKARTNEYFFDARSHLGPEEQNIHHYFWKCNVPNSDNIDNATYANIVHDNHYVFAITRDPIRRFLSMYANRVMHHRELSEGSKAFRLLSEAGLPADPPIDMLVNRLGEYLACSPSIMHHTRPMMDFLGPNLTVYTRLADISELDSVLSDIVVHWKANGLENFVKNARPPQRLQTGGPKLGLDALAKKSFETLLEYYDVDYTSIPTVSRSAIVDEFFRASTGKGGRSH